MKHDSGSITEVINAVKKDIEEDQKKNLDQIEVYIDKQKKEFDKKLKQEYDKIVSEGKKLIEEEKEYMIQQSILNRQKKLLALKKKLFEDFIELLKARIIEYSYSDEYLRIIKKKIREYKKQYKKITVISGKNTYEKIKAKDKAIIYQKSQTVKTGVIIEDQKKTFKIDLTFENLLDSKMGEFSKDFFKTISINDKKSRGKKRER